MKWVTTVPNPLDDYLARRNDGKPETTEERKYRLEVTEAELAAISRARRDMTDGSRSLETDILQVLKEMAADAIQVMYVVMDAGPDYLADQYNLSKQRVREIVARTASRVATQIRDL